MYFKIVKITNFIRKYEVGHREGEREAGLSSLSPQSWGEARGHLSLSEEHSPAGRQGQCWCRSVQSAEAHRGH